MLAVGFFHDASMSTCGVFPPTEWLRFRPPTAAAGNRKPRRRLRKPVSRRFSAN
jgi:hypothetical protein